MFWTGPFAQLLGRKYQQSVHSHLNVTFHPINKPKRRFKLWKSQVNCWVKIKGNHLQCKGISHVPIVQCFCNLRSFPIVEICFIRTGTKQILPWAVTPKCLVIVYGVPFEVWGCFTTHPYPLTHSLTSPTPHFPPPFDSMPTLTSEMLRPCGQVSAANPHDNVCWK